AGRTIVHSLAEGPTVRAPWEEVAVVDGVCLCLRRATLEAVGGIDEGYGFFHGYDRDLSFAVRETGRRCVVVHAPFRHAGGGTRRLAAAATTAGDAGSALIAHTAAAYAALRLSRLDTVLREAEAAVAAGDKARDWPFTGTFVARARRFAGLALAQIGRPGDAE